MSHDYGWRDSCAAGGVTAIVVGSGALLGILSSGFSIPAAAAEQGNRLLLSGSNGSNDALEFLFDVFSCGAWWCQCRHLFFADQMLFEAELDLVDCAAPFCDAGNRA